LKITISVFTTTCYTERNRFKNTFNTHVASHSIIQLFPL